MRETILSLVLALSLATALVPLAAGQTDTVREDTAPVLVEAMPNPAGTDRGNEWVELHNPTPVPMQLDPFYLTDHDACFLPGEGLVEDHRYNLTGTVPANGRLVVTLPGSCLLLSNQAETLTLEDEPGHALQNLSYGPDTDQPAPPGGKTLAACQALATHAWWQIAHPSPNAANPACSPL